MARIVITGSRKFNYLAFVRLAIASLPEGTFVITGGAEGVDTSAEKAAKNAGHKGHVENANWRPNGVFDKGAGFKRNIKMLDMLVNPQNGDRVLAFWDGSSKGTKHTIDNAKRKNLSYRIFTEQDVKRMGVKRLNELIQYCQEKDITFIRFAVFLDEEEDLYDSIDNWYIEYAGGSEYPDGSEGNYSAFPDALVELLFQVQATWPNNFSTGIFEIFIELEGNKLSKTANIDTEGVVQYLPKPIDIGI